MRGIGNTYRAGAFHREPLLNLQYRFVAMLRSWLETAIEALFSSGRIDVHVARRFHYDSRAQKSLDQPKTDIGPCDHALGLRANVGKLCGKLISKGPMGRGLSPGQQAGPRKRRNAKPQCGNAISGIYHTISLKMLNSASRLPARVGIFFIGAARCPWYVAITS